MTVEERIRSYRPPEEAEAEERSWRVVQAAFAEQRVPAQRRPMRSLRLAAVGAVLVAGLAAGGAAVAGLFNGGNEERPGSAGRVLRLPGPGRLLVQSDQGPWVVRRDGSKRLLGRYHDASWSPRGLFVVATRGRGLVALEPGGKPRWSISSPAVVADPRWAPSGFRIAYRSGDSLRVVAGDGSADREVLPRVAPVAAAWRPGGRHVLVAADAGGRLRALDVDSGRVVWRGPVVSGIRQLAWSADGRRVAALSRDGVRLLDNRGTVLRALPGATAMAFAPGGHELALVRGSQLSVGGRRVFAAGAGTLAAPAWSPDGRWLLVGWPAANQWIFIRPGGERLVASASVAQQFDPGAVGSGAFPRVIGWAP